MITHKSIGYNGRLGNQMFQYAALKSLSLKTGFSCFLPNNFKVKQEGVFDFTSNKWIEYRLDLLDCFDINCPILETILPLGYQEQNFTFDPKIFNTSDNTSIEGYFQSYKYFVEFEKEIKKEFTFKQEILTKNTQTIHLYNNPVSIHIRRGDYVNNSDYWNITPEYIQEALSYFNDNEYTFLIFSDDIDWCRQIFPDDVVFIEGNSAFDDLCLMSLCQHNIISNSSFSWWGAYLNNNPNKKIIAPSNWFTNPKPLIDLYPSNWIII